MRHRKGDVPPGRLRGAPVNIWGGGGLKRQTRATQTKERNGRLTVWRGGGGGARGPNRWQRGPQRRILRAVPTTVHLNGQRSALLTRPAAVITSYYLLLPVITNYYQLLPITTSYYQLFSTIITDY